jgi:hypothetical protein
VATIRRLRSIVRLKAMVQLGRGETWDLLLASLALEAM